MSTKPDRGFRPDLRVANALEKLSETQFAYLMMVPLAILLGSMALWPLLSTFEMSLHADNLVSSARTGEFVGLTNYVEMISGQRNPLLSRPFLDFSQPFTSAVIVTLIFTVAAVSVQTVIGFSQALILDKSFRGRRWVRLALIFPWTVPIVIQGMIFFLIFQPGVGFGTAWLNSLGIVSEAPLANSQDALLVVILSDIWKQSAFMSLLILAGLQSVDRTLYNVSKVAGASRWQQFRTITLPLVMPAVLVALLFRTLGAMKVYGSIATITSCNTVPSLTCLVVSTFNSGRYASAATIAFIMAFVIAAVLLVYIVAFRRQSGNLL